MKGEWRWSQDQFESLLDVDFLMDHAVVPDSIPGYPLSTFGKNTNKELFADPEARIVVKRMFYERMKLLSNVRNYDMTPIELVNTGYCDPVRVFVKNELHKRKKIQEKRFRLIWAVSVVDNMVERVLIGPSNEHDIANFWDVPGKSGMDLMSDSVNANLVEKVKSWGRDAAHSDMSGWDMSVQWWMIISEAWTRAENLGLKEQDWARRAIFNRAWCVANSVLILSDGNMYAQTNPGMQKSGSYNTSCGNSRMRAMLSYYVGAKNCITMGDDCVEEFVEGAKDAYDALGVDLKLYERNPDGFEFCSAWYSYKTGTATPTGFYKGLGNLLQNANNPFEILMQQWQQFLHQYRHSEEVARAVEILTTVRWGSSNDDPNGPF